MDLTNLRINFDQKIAACKTTAELEGINVAFLGKKGLITECMMSIKTLPLEDRPKYGASINEVKGYIDGVIQETGDRLKTSEIDSQMAGMDAVDLSEICTTLRGSLHPVTIVQREIEEIFLSMGFSIESEDEVVTEYENFESVNIPAEHPARDMQDTFFLSNGQLLKTQTSAMQNRVLRAKGAPLRAIFPGRCFRNESVDASHDTTFFQMEGLVVDKDISIANLKYFLDVLLSKVLGVVPVTRLRPGYFPFTEPGMELDMQCGICGGGGCPTCKGSGWVEILPCGMVHPRVLELGGVDSTQYTGFAFGLGLTRLAMMKYGIDNIRQLNAGNVQVMSQFGTK